MIDTHCHLGALRARRRASWSPTRRGSGCGGCSRVGHRRGRRARRRSPPPRRTRRCSPRSAATRTGPPASTIAAADADRGAGAAPAGRGGRRDGARLLPRPRPRADQRHAFRAQIEIARRVAKPLVIHVRDGGATTDGEALEETFEILRAEAAGVAVILHCFSAPAGARLRGGRVGLVLLVRRQRHLPEVRRPCARRPRAVPDELLLVETDSPFLAPQPVRGKPNEPANVVATAEAVAEVRGVSYARARGAGRGERRPSSGGDARAMSEDVAGGRLGQNFLADPNLLEAIVREAGSGPSDVVLEVGGGEGALTAQLAPLVAGGARGRARPAAGARARGARRRAPRTSSSTSATRCRSSSAALDPAPNRMVANLPYSIATPLILRTIAELPGLERWTLMVQREIADRLRAAPGSRTYGAPSVLVQLACEVRMLRAVDRAVFTPRPAGRLGADRAAAARARGLRREVAGLVRDAFAHRRKSLARSLEHAAAGVARARRGRRSSDSGCRPTRAPRQLAPSQFVAAGRSARGGRRDPAGAGEAQPLPLPRRRAATTACTSCARCSARCCSPTGSR